MAKAPLLARADAGVLELARMTKAEIATINERVALSLVAANERAAAGRTFTPPTNNMGGKSQEEHVIMVDGHPLVTLKRRGYHNNNAFVDWVNFTAHEDAFRFMEEIPVTDDEVVMEASRVCESLFGFGITEVCKLGKNFYERSYVLGDGWGYICHGGQRNTVLVMLSGAGCSAAAKDWEKRLYDFLEGAKGNNARITRADLSYDDFTGSQVSVDAINEAHTNGEFNNGGRNPVSEMRGDWKNPNGAGRTFYVGTRRNGKFFRGYEKGRQLGDKSSEWVRLEVEFKAVDRDIPFDVLLNTGDYFSAAYPFLNRFNSRQERILTIQKTVQVSYEKSKAWLKHQCGGVLGAMVQVEGSAQAVFDLIARDGVIPRSWIVPDFRDVEQADALHNRVPVMLPYRVAMEATFS